MSSARAELYAVLEALHIVAPLHKNVYFFIDIQAALYVIQSTSPMDYDLVNKCLDLIHTLEGVGAMVHFIWIPSHVGIPLNEKPDCLAQCALQDDTVDPGTEYTLDYVKSSIKDFVHNSISDQLELCCHRGSGTSLHYACVSQSCAYTYRKHCITRQDGNEGQIRLQILLESQCFSWCVLWVVGCVLHQGDTFCVTISWNVLSLLNLGDKVNMICIASLNIF
ncbi:hypothetical protein E2C01_066398 [Portunus trituberculatus]|uniref:RNase H type-1 domain-containing protein n=1 Tax=Portunus trituberculatus TaxID=210409 RepID=A0A5B7HQX8_PORTR|nr:hypothetical protein [Portunus trituberculatus]